MAPIPPARLLSAKAHILPGQLYMTEMFFEVPLDYSNPSAGTLKLFACSFNKFERPPVPPTEEDHKPYFVYLEGGPGMGNREPQDNPLTRWSLNRGYQALYLDYRGTGYSTPVNAEALLKRGSPEKQAEYLALFRADNIVRDLEAVRLRLVEGQPESRQKWSLFGQSFGGFVALTYLSYHPHALREVFMAGGLAPLHRTAEEVYTATYRKVAQRNEAYYAKYPEDIANVHRIADVIAGEGVPLPAGGKLTLGRLLTIGLTFGAHGGLDAVHAMILKLVADLDQFGFFTRASLTAFEQFIPFDSTPVYAILHESIYCYQAGVASNWAAYRVGRELPEFRWLGRQQEHHVDRDRDRTRPIYFTGEMVFPFHFDTYPELVQMKAAADVLARHAAWPEPLYDLEQLRRNEVPVYAASFVDDMYVDFELARETARAVRGIRVFETNGLYHNALKARSDEVLGQLAKLRDDVMD